MDRAGQSLVLLGSAMLLLGIVYHIRFMLELLLLTLGVVAITSMVFDVGPLG